MPESVKFIIALVGGFGVLCGFYVIFRYIIVRYFVEIDKNFDLLFKSRSEHNIKLAELQKDIDSLKMNK